MSSRTPSELLSLCRTIGEYAALGHPVKDAIQDTDYTTSELIIELAGHYLAWENYEL